MKKRIRVVKKKAEGSDPSRWATGDPGLPAPFVADPPHYLSSGTSATTATTTATTTVAPSRVTQYGYDLSGNVTRKNLSNGTLKRGPMTGATG